MDNTHGNVYFGVANGTPCTMHSLAWDNADEEEDALQAIAKGTPGKVIDLPTAPDHIVVNIKPEPGITWPQHLNLAPGLNFIQIPIGLTTQCDKKVQISPQESVAYYAHAVDLAFAVTV